MPKDMRQLRPRKRDHRVRAKRPLAPSARSSPHPIPTADRPQPPAHPASPQSPAAPQRKPAQRRLEPRPHHRIHEQLRRSSSHHSAPRSAASSATGLHRDRRSLRRSRAAPPPPRPSPRPRAPAAAPRTATPASASTRAATNPSPPLLPLPQSTATRRAAGYRRRQNARHRRARVLHQLRQRHAELLRRPPVRRAHLRRGQNLHLSLLRALGRNAKPIRAAAQDLDPRIRPRFTNAGHAWHKSCIRIAKVAWCSAGGT